MPLGVVNWLDKSKDCDKDTVLRLHGVDNVYSLTSLSVFPMTYIFVPSCLKYKPLEPGVSPLKFFRLDVSIKYAPLLFLYNTLSPVLKLWSVIVIVSVVVLSPESVKLIGLMTKPLICESYRRSTDVDVVPTPTEISGITERLILSLFFKLCDVETETVVLICSTSTVTGVKVVSNR